MKKYLIPGGISHLALVAALAGGAAPALAQDASDDDVITLDTLTLSASQKPVALSRTGATVSVLNQDDIQASGALSFGELVSNLPGVSVSSNGGMGTLTSVRIRGLSSYYIGTRIDGIDVSDPSQTQTAYDFGATTTGGLARVEVLRGSQSALYGSEAIGGVIDITTWRPTKEGTSGQIGIEGGSNHTWTGTGSVGLRTDRAELAFSLSRTITDGISAYADGDEDDAFRATFGSLYAAYQLTDGLRVGVNGFRRQSYAEFDSSTGDTDSSNTTNLRGGRVFALVDAGDLTHEFSVARTKTERDVYDWGSYTYYTGDRDQYSYHGAWTPGGPVSLTWGLDRTEEEFDMASAFGGATGKARTNSVFAELLYAPTSDLDLSFALRHDDHDAFGGKATGRLALAWRPDADWVLRGVASTGFRAPSLYELHSTYGNTDLEPETSRSLELGVERLLPNGGSIQATLFNTRIKDRIIFDDASYACEAAQAWFYPGCYAQVDGHTTTRGIEIVGRTEIVDGWSVFGNYTYTDAISNDDGDRSRLAQAPRHDLTLGVEGRIADQWSARAALHHVGDFISTEAGTFPVVTKKMPDYTTVDMGVTYDVNDSTQAYLRVENLFDKDYQVIDGYGRPGRQVFVGVRTAF